MNTLGTTPTTVIKIEESYGINLGRVMSTGTPQKGMFVKLDNAGTVSPITAATQIPMGMITSAYDGNAEDGAVRVATQYSSVIVGKAAAGFNAGTHLAVTGFDTTDDCPTVATAVATNWVSAVALEVAAGANSLVEIGVLRVPYLKA